MSESIGWIAMKFGTNMTGSQMIHPNYFSYKANIQLKIQVLRKPVSTSI